MLSITHRTVRPRPAPRDGFSLVEVLLAATLLLVVVVSVLPLFSNALERNAAGGRASVMTTFAMEDLEEINQGAIDHDDWDLTANVLDLGKEYWADAAADRMGDERWEADTLSGGPFYWERSAKIRKYLYADVTPGYIDVEGAGIVGLGHPELYDSPVSSDGSGVHIVELRVTIQPRSGLPLSQGQQLTVGHFRAY